MINDNGDIDKIFGDKYTIRLRKYNRVIRLNWVINNEHVKKIPKINRFWYYACTDESINCCINAATSMI